MASAEVGSVLSGGGVWWGVSRFQPTRGSGGASSWAPPAGSGALPGRKRILPYFEGHRMLLFVHIWQKSEGGQFALASPTTNSGGLRDLSPAFPMIYTHGSADCYIVVGDSVWCVKWWTLTATNCCIVSRCDLMDFLSVCLYHWRYVHCSAVGKAT